MNTSFFSDLLLVLLQDLIIALFTLPITILSELLIRFLAPAT